MSDLDFSRDNKPLSTARLLWSIFGQDQPHYAKASFDGDNVTYRPVDRALEVSDVERHLQGDITLGAYQLLQDDHVRWIAWDFDSPVLETAKDMTSKLVQVMNQSGIPHAVEFSGSKGYHVFLFLEEPVPASKAKTFAEGIREALGLPKVGPDHTETFPKQDELTSTNPYGNLIKMPLGIHPRTHNWSRFVDPNNGWESGEDVDPIVALQQRIDFASLRKMVSAPDPLERLVNTLIPIWVEGNRHDVALALAGYLASVGWGMEKTEQLIRDVCDQSGDTDVGNRIDAVRDTFQKLSTGQPIVGMSRLQDLLPGSVVKTIVEIATQQASPDSVRQIDAIRNEPKTASFLKVRAAATKAWSYLNEHGIPLQTMEGSKQYWFNSSTHHLIELGTVAWEAFAAKTFGINLRDSFSSQMDNDIRLRFVREANKVEVHRRSYWDGDRLFVHLDGEHVYVLDGDEIHIEYNGECGVMFQDLGTEPTILDTETPPSDLVWESLTNDLSFTKSVDAPATPGQQREMLKAWMLSFFFPQLMATRPILCCLGSSGSGKTTAMRRLLWVYEDPYTNVLELVSDKSDALRTSMSAHKLLVLDNLEKTTSTGLVDIMNRMATGADIEMRKLYTTNELLRIKPDVFLAITAVNLPFSEETLFSRLLPIEMQQVERPKPEHILQRELKSRRKKIWISILHQLNEVILCLKRNPEREIGHVSRLADYVMFSHRLEGHPSINYSDLVEGLNSMVDRQVTLLRSSSPFVEILEMWIRQQPQQASEYNSLQGLWNILKPLAKNYGMEWPWTSIRVLEQHFRVIEGDLSKHYGMHIQESIENGKTVKVYSFNRQNTLL